jgi:uncharacterized phage protein (TIGR02218 family)
MKTLPSGMQTDLDSGATTHCFCWKITCKDATVLGFTDHDNDLTFDSVTYEAEAALSASALDQSVSLNVDSADAIGAIQSDVISEEDLAGGKFDDAEVIVYRVDWSNTTKRIILFRGSIGNVSRRRIAFTAELRSLSHYLNQPLGRIYSKYCDTDLGSSRCGINLNSGTYKVTADVSVVSNRRQFQSTTSGILAKDNGYYNYGFVEFTSGDNDGQKMEIKSFTKVGSVAYFELWEALPYDIVSGDDFIAVVGCGKSVEICKAKFDNVINFQGFPLMPGTDRLLKVARKRNANTGGSLRNGGE